MDLIVNRIDEEAGIYKNNARTKLPFNNYIKLKLQGTAKTVRVSVQK